MIPDSGDDDIRSLPFGQCQVYVLVYPGKKASARSIRAWAIEPHNHGLGRPGANLVPILPASYYQSTKLYFGHKAEPIVFTTSYIHN